MWDRAWDKVFENNEWGKYPTEELIRFIARNFYNVPDRKKVKMLEVGTGTGANLWYLSREGFDVSGIDGSKIGVEKTKRRLKADHLKADVSVSDVVNMPFMNDTFDCIIDAECIYANSYKDSKKILDEIHRVLKPKGKFFSKTFMVGTTGDGKGKKLKGEKNTYLEFQKGAFRTGCGITRFTSEDEIWDLYGKFKIESIDYVIRTEKNRKIEIREWIIAGSKP